MSNSKYDKTSPSMGESSDAIGFVIQCEPLLDPTLDRFVYTPRADSPAEKLFDDAQKLLWTRKEIDFEEDIRQWSEILNENERKFIKMILSFFSSSDGIVGENIVNSFMLEIQDPSLRNLYGLQIYTEVVHSQTYADFIGCLPINENEKIDLRRGLYSINCVKKKSEWGMKWMNKERPFRERIVAFVVVEGLLFSGSFCAIFWLKKRGLMPGFSHANELISRDEAWHTDLGCLVYDLLIGKCSQERILEIVLSGVEVEKEFIDEALDVRLIGMNSDLMKQYIEYVADNLLEMLGVERYFNTPNPFDWMKMLGMERKTNFFERRVSEYQHIKSSKNIKALDEINNLNMSEFPDTF